MTARTMQTLHTDALDVGTDLLLDAGLTLDHWDVRSVRIIATNGGVSVAVVAESDGCDLTITREADGTFSASWDGKAEGTATGRKHPNTAVLDAAPLWVRRDLSFLWTADDQDERGARVSA